MDGTSCSLGTHHGKINSDLTKTVANEFAEVPQRHLKYRIVSILLRYHTLRCVLLDLLCGLVDKHHHALHMVCHFIFVSRKK